jgi:alkylation response protein AidB-like acyl-CoA dehydrogenase
VVVGQKVWSTCAQWSDYSYLLARTEPVEGPAGISAFILDMCSLAVDFRPLRKMTGTTNFNEVFFDEVRVLAAIIIGRPRRAGAPPVPAWPSSAQAWLAAPTPCAASWRRPDGAAAPDTP